MMMEIWMEIMAAMSSVQILHRDTLAMVEGLLLNQHANLYVEIEF